MSARAALTLIDVIGNSYFLVQRCTTLLRAAIGDRFAGTRVRQSICLGHDQARLRARLFAAGVIAAETSSEDGWQVEIDAPRAALEPLFGLPDGDGERLRGHLKLAAADAI